MRYRRLTGTDLVVPVIGLGTYQMSGTWGKVFTQDEVSDILAAAQECGMTLLDTAECYGVDHQAERMIGNAMKTSRARWTIATKFGHIRYDTNRRVTSCTPEAVLSQLEGSLRALRTDHVDLYQLHSGENEQFENKPLWDTLRKQVKLGKIRYLGVSLPRDEGDAGVFQTRRAPDVGASVIQVKYNRLEQAAGLDILPECMKNGIGVIARVPLASGLLSGRYQHLGKFDDHDTRASKYDTQTIAQMQQQIDHILRQELPAGASLVEYALTWSLKHPAVSCVIPGCKTAEHVRQNARAAESIFLRQDHPLDVT